MQSELITVLRPRHNRSNKISNTAEALSDDLILSAAAGRYGDTFAQFLLLL